LLLVALLVALWLVYSVDGSMNSWAFSAQALRQGRVYTLPLHLLAHGSLVHLIVNGMSLLLLSAPLISRLGKPPLSWARYLYVFVGSGLAGAVLFLALHTGQNVAMLGASGAIFGLLGAVARVHPSTGESVPVNSRRTWEVLKLFAGNHLVLFGLLAIVALVAGASPMLAWEAHLGGLLFGFFAAPVFLRRPETLGADD
jgi:membrane associated rhomboid family serine protease